MDKGCNDFPVCLGKLACVPKKGLKGSQRRWEMELAATLTSRVQEYVSLRKPLASHSHRRNQGEACLGSSGLCDKKVPSKKQACTHYQNGIITSCAWVAVRWDGETGSDVSKDIMYSSGRRETLRGQPSGTAKTSCRK